MFTFTFLLTTLAIISPILSSPIEPRRWGHEIDAGVLTSETIPGFIGDRPVTGPDGDYLRATFCYCKTAMSDITPRATDDFPDGGLDDGQTTAGGNGIQPGEILQGHFWRYEYFNYHDNATYFLNHYCMEDAFPEDKHGCGYDSPGEFEPNPQNFWNTVGENFQSDYALTYSPLPNHKLHSWSIYKMQEDLDWIYYGRGPLIEQQKRRLGKDQGLIMMPKEYVDDKCSNYCDTELLLPMDPTMPSHGELYNDIDDMCDRCK